MQLAVIMLGLASIAADPADVPPIELAGMEIIVIQSTVPRDPPELRYMSLGSKTVACFDAPCPVTVVDRASRLASADAAAAVAADRADDPATAAKHFLACAQRFRNVRNDDPEIESAKAQARTCYRNMHSALSYAGTLDTVGPRMFRDAIRADPRHAAFLRTLAPRR